MNKRFIVLTDFSSYSRSLIKYACDWSRQAKAELILVHQTTVVAPGLIGSESKQRLTQQANEEALQMLKSMANELIPSSVKTSFLVSESHLQQTLSVLLAERFDNLIFAGLKGTGLLKKIFLGSVALQVIEVSDNIVVAVPKEIETFSHRRLFVAVKDTQSLNVLGLNRLLDFMDKEKTDIIFFYLAKPDEETSGIERHLGELAGLFADRFETSFDIYVGKSAFADIERVINDKIDEILIVQKGARLLTDHVFRRFLINQLVYKGQTPLIVLP
jgi:nucleotide-binding universal stress UspA family protein